VFKGKALDKSKSALSTDDLTHLVEIGTQKGSLEGEEKELIKGVVGARDIIVRQVMMPRVDITAVEADTALEEVLELIRSTGHSRIPVYEEDLDTVIGVLYMKDLLPYLSPSADREKFSAQSLVRIPLFVPEYRPVTDLLQEFQEKKTHIAVVVDEYGGTSGIVTMEDLLEAIVGDIKDELDTDSNEITSTDDQTFILQGSATIDEVNEALSISIDVYNEEYDTISGFILKEAGRIPKRGFSVEHEGFKFTVTEIINNRIQIITAKRCRK
jgi:CBS domain containing-hemolysin-like protein